MLILFHFTVNIQYLFYYLFINMYKVNYHVKRVK